MRPGRTFQEGMSQPGNRGGWHRPDTDGPDQTSPRRFGTDGVGKLGEVGTGDDVPAIKSQVDAIQGRKEKGQKR